MPVPMIEWIDKKGKKENPLLRSHFLAEKIVYFLFFRKQFRVLWCLSFFIHWGCGVGWVGFVRVEELCIWMWIVHRDFCRLTCRGNFFNLVSMLTSHDSTTIVSAAWEQTSPYRRWLDNSLTWNSTLESHSTTTLTILSTHYILSNTV